MSTRRLPFHIDFAGTHGTAWGTFNVCFAVLNVTTLERYPFHAPWWIAAVTMGGGFLLVLSMAAFRRAYTPPTAVAYQMACWAGSGIWSAWMLRQPHWTMRSWGLGVLILASAAVVGGIALALGKKEQPATSAALAATVGPMAQTTGMSSAQRDALALQWVRRIDRLSGNKPDPKKPEGHVPRVKVVTAIEDWPTGAGYTIQGQFSSGAFGLQQLEDLSGRLATDANLPYGCGVQAIGVPGGGRLEFGLKVATSNELLKPQLFPVDGGPWTINGPVPVAATASGSHYGPRLRQRNWAIYGMPGSGKTGAMKAASCALGLTVDVVLAGIDATGGDLVRPALSVWERGLATHPMFSTVATSYTLAERLCRAMLRVGHARKEAYGGLMREHNTTLIPIGATVRRADLQPAARSRFTHPDDHERIVPQVIIVCDETKAFLSLAGKEWKLRDIIAQGMAELRLAGVRYLFGPLGTSDANIAQSIQNLVHTNTAMLLATAGEYAGALGAGVVIRSTDFPDMSDGSGKVPGVGFVRDTIGAPHDQIRFFGEMTPSVVDEVALRASQIGTLPELDYVSELAADGFRPDGTPWPMEPGIMEPGDELYWTRRWDDWETRRNEKEPDEDDSSAPAGGTEPKPVLTMEELRARVAKTKQESDAHIAELTGCAVEDVDLKRAAMEEDLEAAAARWPSTIEALVGPAPEPDRWQDRVMRAIREAPAEGVQAKDLIAVAGVDRSEVYKFLAPLVQTRKLWQPKTGFYAIPGDER